MSEATRGSRDAAAGSAPAVAVSIPSPGVAELRMQHRESHNGFSSELCLSLIEAFRWVESNEEIRVVVLTGYDNYFCSGGTRSGLLAIQQKVSSFTDVNVYSLALDCSVPVVAAIQGHAFGGGLALGLYADVIVLSRESVFAANFMSYGLTPGVGASYVMKCKLGIALTEEMLLTAATFRGATLQERGVPFRVLPRAQVLAHAHARAREIAEKPRRALELLKRHLVGQMRAELPAVIQAEVAMHGQTAHEENVRERINAQFQSFPEQFRSSPK
jgi:4-carboxy-3-alkylbut-2-enoyl-[acp] decarboxylase